MPPVETDIKTDDEKAGLDSLGDMMGDMAPAEFVDKAKPPDAADASPEAKPEDDVLSADPQWTVPPATTRDAEPKGDPAPADKPAEEPKADAVVDDGPSEEEAIAALAGPLSHDEVSQSPSFKGLLGEVTTTRAENKLLKDRIAEFEANAEAPAAEADPHGALFEEDDDDDDLSTLTKGETKALIVEAARKAAAEAVAPIQAERQADTSLSNVQADVVAMKADPAIPDGIPISRLCIEARKHMAANSPELLKSIDGKPGMSRELYNYGVLRVPSVRSVVARASSTQTADATQRALRGQETTDEPKEFFEMLGFTEGDDVPEPTE